MKPELVTAPAADPPRLDLRLTLPALLAWAVLVALLPRATAVLVGVGAASGVAALIAGRAWRGQLALCLAAVSLLSLAAAGHALRDRAGPVPGWAQEEAVVTVVARVTTEPRVITRGDEREPLVVLDLRLLYVQGRGQSVDVATPVVVMAGAGDGWEYVTWRSTIEARGRLVPVEPGDRALAMLVPRGAPETRESPGGVLALADHVRDRFRLAVDPLPADARGLVPGLVIGDTSLTPPDLTEDMRATGMTHLSAVSGSNVALVTGALALLVGAVGVPRRARTPLVLLGLVGFVLLCRPEPSVLRAAVMGTVGLLALSSARRRVSLPALGAAVLGLLCVDPWLARSYGFALSTLATLGLVVWARPWGSTIGARLPRRLAVLGDAVAVPLAAQVACAPVIVLLQGSITTVAVIANLLAAPLVAPTTVLGVLAAVVAPLSLPVATLIAWAAALPAWLLGRIARVFADVPYGTLDWVDGPPGALLLAGLTVAVLVTGPWWRAQLRQRPGWGYAALGAVGALLWPTGVPGSWPPPGWVVVGCDVGQGDAFVVRTGPGSALVVDTGPDPGAVRRCLRALGIDTVDALVLTHFHADHVGGLGGVLDQAEVRAAYVGGVHEPAETAAAALAELAAEQVPVEQVGAGRTMVVGEVVVEVVWPGDRVPPGGSAANNASLVLDVRAGATRMLFTGDIEPEAARPLARALRGRDYDVLKVAHHGSAAQDPSLVTGTRAEIALIGVAADNTFGHPAPSALTLLREAGMVVLRTDTDGDIAVSRDSDGLVVHRRDP